MPLFPIAVSPLWLGILSELAVNLAAGWIGAIIVVPIALEQSIIKDAVDLTLYLSLAILALVIAKRFREYQQYYEF